METPPADWVVIGRSLAPRRHRKAGERVSVRGYCALCARAAALSMVGWRHEARGAARRGGRRCNPVRVRCLAFPRGGGRGPGGRGLGLHVLGRARREQTLLGGVEVGSEGREGERVVVRVVVRRDDECPRVPAEVYVGHEACDGAPCAALASVP